jgi:cytosine/adenosine deaminase-related metal-dependent hydrolase
VLDVDFALLPGSVLVERLSDTIGDLIGAVKILAVGTPQQVDQHPGARAARLVALPDDVIFPGLVNAHAHLDLTHIGPQPHDPKTGFVPWVDMVRSHRHTEDADIAASVRQGIDLARSAGTVAIGDIAGAPMGRMSLVPWRTMREARMPGVSYIEFFGIGASREPREAGLRALVESVREEAESAAQSSLTSARLGLQPHAPNTVDKRLYELAIDLLFKLPEAHICTHLAETPEERRFVAAADGPQRELLERFNLWTDDVLVHLGKNLHPVAHLETILSQHPFTVVHVNDADDAAIEILARTGATVVYCPRASAYFGAHEHFGPHRYQDMLAAGIPVALGTDSIINLPDSAARTTDAGGTGISILDEMRFLYRRDSADPATLVEMATRIGASALGLANHHAGIVPGNLSVGLCSSRIQPQRARANAASTGIVGELLLQSNAPARLL